MDETCLLRLRLESSLPPRKLEVVGKNNLRASDVYTSYMTKRRVTL